MPGNPAAMPKLTNCVPNPNTWQGLETEKSQDKKPGKAADAALAEAMNAAKKLADAFLAQDCTTAGCTWKDHGPPKYTPGEITIVPDRPPDAAHKGQKGLFWEATAKVSWSATAYCYPTQKARDAGKDARETAEKKAKEEEEKSAKPAK